VLNNVSRDHKEMDELRQLFGEFLRRARHCAVNVDDAEARALAPGHSVTFGLRAGARLRAIDLAPRPDGIGFTLNGNAVSLALPGAHNVSNALAALAAAQLAGVPLPQASEALEGFTGLRRRLEVVGHAAGVTVIDDFGHNPDKIAATLATLRAFPGRLLILFQPHGYGPLKQLRGELAEAFAAGLGADDLLLLPDPAYFGGTVAREVGSGELAADIRALGRDARHVPERSEAAHLLVREARAGDRIVVMGARDDTLGVLAREMLDGLAQRG
jgi:UDP-N-acetylmuramate--alanine ligase